jgi:hypothetical protein
VLGPPLLQTTSVAVSGSGPVRRPFRCGTVANHAGNLKNHAGAGRGGRALAVLRRCGHLKAAKDALTDLSVGFTAWPCEGVVRLRFG